METIKILLADDHQMIIDGLNSLLENQENIEVVGEAHDGEQVLEKIKWLKELDIVVLDINMPKKDGIEVCKEIKSSYPEIRVLILTMYNRKEFIKNLLESGADGYILKNAGKKVLMEALESLFQGETYYGKEVTETIIRGYQKNRNFQGMQEVELSDREKEVIKLIAQEQTTMEIADQLCLSPHTIDTHRKNILSKLNVKNAAGLVWYAIQTGIVKDF